MIKPRALTSLSFFFPCYNEALNIGGMIEQAVKVGESYGIDYEIVIVDDGSRDASAEVVRRYAAGNPRVRLVQHAENRGYGAALRTGLANARKDLVFLCDGDNQFQVGDIEKLFSKIDDCDAVVGYRIRRQDASYRRLAGSFWTRLTRLLFGLGVRDVDCAFKLFRRKCLQGLELRSDYLLIHAEILARLKKRGLKIGEIGIPHHPRQAGTATATRPAALWRSLVELCRLYWRIRTSPSGGN